MDQVHGSLPSSKSRSSSSFLSFKMYKTDEEFNQCRYESSCELAHGKEEIRPIKSHINSTPKCLKCSKLHNHHHHHQVMNKESPSQDVKSARPPNLPRPPEKEKKKKKKKKQKDDSTTTGHDWSPSHDGIHTNPSLVRDTQHSTIDAILYGSTRRKTGRDWTASNVDSNPPPSAMDNVGYSPNGSDYWSPCDDGISVDGFSTLFHKNLPQVKDEAIDSVLYDSTRRKRLPSFAEFCFDNE